MDFATRAQVRFGFGPAPGQAAPETAKAILQALAGPDRMAERWPGIGTRLGLQLGEEFHRLKKAASDKENPAGQAAAEAAFKQHKAKINNLLVGSLQTALARAVEDETGFRERLWAFWRDHFTVQGKRRQDVPLAVSHAEAAVRPYIARSFPEMLRAAVTHPMMLIYLDQVSSFGPNSKRAQKRPDRKIGLNENLAREVMELHTLGVGGRYSQDDVRQLAELFTGMRVAQGEGLVFAPDLAEPGAEQVLGRAYGGDPAKLSDIFAVLDALALHPDTARHLAWKLAVHFIGPEPDAALVGAMAEAYLGAQGQLAPVYAVLLEHPAAQEPRFAKVRQPFDFIATAMRALGLDGAAVMALDGKAMRQAAYWPMRDMGQQWLAPRGPDGWPEAAEDWIAPQQLSARINWAARAPQIFGVAPRDPAAFATTALGPRQSPALARAVPRAETKAEGVALVLASAEFMRR